MFYEERMIDGLLCYRSRPDAEWRPISTQELSRRAAQVTELVKALRQYADPMNWGYRDEGGCEKGHGRYEDACFVGREIAEAAIAAAEGGAK